jgi:hypothetical protein
MNMRLENSMSRSSVRRPRILLALSLFLLAPLVGEWLLGNQPITSLGNLLLLATMYGGGALLVREVALRFHRGWLTILLLAAAYALLEEGPIDQMLWNPHYRGIDMAAAYAATYVPFLGTSIEMLQGVLSLHTIWSIAVPIALIEAFDPTPRAPWLGKFGVGAVTAIFVSGSTFLAIIQVWSENFMASAREFSLAGIAIVALVMAAFLVPRQSSKLNTEAPSPLIAGLTVFVATSINFLHELLPIPPWVGVGMWFVIAGALVVLVSRWSRSRGWSERHVLALAGGALLTYVWVGFEHSRYLGVSPQIALVGNVLFGGGAIFLLSTAIRVVRRRGK